MSTNYRKAKKGDIKCSVCVKHKEPDWCEKRIRCMIGAQNNAMLGYAVGKNMTCDRASLEDNNRWDNWNAKIHIESEIKVVKMSEHTKGKLEVSSSNSESIYVLKDGRADGLFAMCDAGDYARGIEEGRANAKELVRRWNAFEENYSVNLVARAVETKQQRDDLLGACEKIMEGYVEPLRGQKTSVVGYNIKIDKKTFELLKAAIAACKT